MSNTVQLAQHLQQQCFDPQSRGIIYCRAEKDAIDLADKLGGGLYTGKIPYAQREAEYADWRQGNHKWMIATSAFIAGVDWPRVDCILFYKTPHDIYDLVQGSGRGGRSGQPCPVILIHAGQPSGLTVQPSNTLDVKQPHVMTNWLNNTLKCRRHAISLCMDGQAQKCQDLSNALHCDICAPTSNFWKNAKAAYNGLLLPQVQNNMDVDNDFQDPAFDAFAATLDEQYLSNASASMPVSTATSSPLVLPTPLNSAVSVSNIFSFDSF